MMQAWGPLFGRDGTACDFTRRPFSRQHPSHRRVVTYQERFLGMEDCPPLSNPGVRRSTCHLADVPDCAEPCSSAAAEIFSILHAHALGLKALV